MTNRRQLFLQELRELLQRHRVEIRAADEYNGYPECGEDIRIFAEFEWEIDDEELFDDIDFGQYIDLDSFEEI